MRHLIPVMLLTMLATGARSQDLTQARADLESIYKSDQAHRAVLDSLLRKEGRNWQDPAIQALLPQMAKQDSANLRYVTALLDRYGWPGRQQLGPVANEAVFLVIQHADSALISHYFPLLAMSYETGGTPGKFYAMMLDRILTERRLPQVFGTQISMEKKGGKYLLFPVADPEALDERRRKAGLPDFRSWAAEMNVMVR